MHKLMIYPDSPDRAGVCACTGDFLLATLLVWAGASAAAPAPMELRNEKYFLLWFRSTRCGVRIGELEREQTIAEISFAYCGGIERVR